MANDAANTTTMCPVTCCAWPLKTTHDGVRLMLWSTGDQQWSVTISLASRDARELLAALQRCIPPWE
jgi:hypothetical protein